MPLTSLENDADSAPVACRFCSRTDGQTKAGLNRSGTHRYRCGTCQRHYTPLPRAQGYPDEIRQQAIEAFTAGVPLRRIARMLGVNHQSVVNWTRFAASPLLEGTGPATATETIPARTVAPAIPAVISPAGGPKQRATIEDVARRAGVAASTISNFLNNKGRMSEETRGRIRTAIDDLHFSPNALVRAIRARRTRILGVLVFDLDRIDDRIDHSVTIPLLAGIYAAADSLGHDILLYTGWPKRPERHSGMDFLNGHVDGLLWAVPGIDAPALARVAAADLPVVAMLSRHVPDNAGYVNGDNEAATRTLVRHLFDHGHRRIALAGPARSSSNYEDRRIGYRQGLQQCGLAYDAALEGATPDMRRIDGACQTLVNDWMRLSSPPSAVIAVTDEWAESIGKAAQSHGLRIPGDFAVTGFDDVLAAQSICGGLTTIRQPFREVGIQAVEQLVRLIEGAPVESCRLTIPLSLIERASTRSA